MKEIAYDKGDLKANAEDDKNSAKDDNTSREEDQKEDNKAEF